MTSPKQKVTILQKRVANKMHGTINNLKFIYVSFYRTLAYEQRVLML